MNLISSILVAREPQTTVHLCTNFLSAADSQQDVLYTLSVARAATFRLITGTLADDLAFWHSAQRRSNETSVDIHSASTAKN